MWTLIYKKYKNLQEYESKLWFVQTPLAGKINVSDAGGPQLIPNHIDGARNLLIWRSPPFYVAPSWKIKGSGDSCMQ